MNAERGIPATAGPASPEGGDTGGADLLWQQLAQDGALDAWLGILAEKTSAELAVVVLGKSDLGPFRREALWPDGATLDEPTAAALDLVLAQRRPIVKSGLGHEGATRCVLASPLLLGETLRGAVALRLRVSADLDLRETMRELQWAAPGLLLKLARDGDKDAAADRLRTATALQLLATTLDEGDFPIAANGAVTELADRLGCDRVSLGFWRRRKTRVAALSHSGTFVRRAELLQRVADAMDEAIDQRMTIAFPEREWASLTVTAAHARLAEFGRERSILTVPMTAGGRIVGALTLERPRGAGFPPADRELAEVVASVLGPVLEEKRRNSRALPVKIAGSVGGGLVALFGPRRPGVKLLGFLLVAAAIAAFTVHTDFRVTADARIEGAVRRVIAAPLDGYVQEASVRPGDLVREGEVMARLDDREIALELKRWETVRAQRQREYETALSARDRAELGIIATQIGQAEAEIALLEERLARTRLTAPFDGVVLSGDLDQSIGAPVTRGTVLFEIAPLDAYRVVLSVDERDLAAVDEGLEGSVVLTSLPGRSYPIETGRVTSVAAVEDGRNVFRVEAAFAEDADELRPGMQGIAKIEVDRRPIAEVWTRNLVTWARLALWRWMP